VALARALLLRTAMTAVSCSPIDRQQATFFWNLLLRQTGRRPVFTFSGPAVCFPSSPNFNGDSAYCHKFPAREKKRDDPLLAVPLCVFPFESPICGSMRLCRMYESPTDTFILQRTLLHQKDSARVYHIFSTRPNWTV